MVSMTFGSDGRDSDQDNRPSGTKGGITSINRVPSSSGPEQLSVRLHVVLGLIEYSIVTCFARIRSTLWSAN